MKIKYVKAQWTPQMTTDKAHFKSDQSWWLLVWEGKYWQHFQESDLTFSAFLKKVHLN